MAKKKTKEQFISEAVLIHGNKYDYSKFNYQNAHYKSIIICPEHGEFWQTPHEHISGKQGCPKCGIKKCTEIHTSNTQEFIEKKFASPVTIEDIAKNADISVSSCLRLFRNVLGTTPIKYLIHYRLQRIAEEFDHLQGATIGEIAFSHGFSDATYFDRCFKKEYGMTPTEYISRQHSKCIEYD